MFNFRLFVLVLLFSWINFKVIASFKCEFPKFDIINFENTYYCNILPDSSDITDNYSPERIGRVEYNGTKHGSVVFTEDEFPFCKKFPNLKMISIIGVESIDADFFKYCKNIDNVKIISTDMQDIPENLFSENLMLNYIELENNKFTTLPENIFSHLKELQTIYLRKNQITSLPSNIFKNLPKLKDLNLYDNKMSILEHDLFKGLEQLEDLSLGSNGITDLPKDIFSPLINLDTIDVCCNKLTTIHSDSFGIHRNLSYIRFDDNEMTAIDERFFDNTGADTAQVFDMDYNICFGKALFYEEESLRSKFKDCFANYKPRGE